MFITHQLKNNTHWIFKPKNYMGLKACVLATRMHCFRLLLNWVSKWVFFAAKKLYCTSDFIFSLSRDLLCKNFFSEIEGPLKTDQINARSLRNVSPAFVFVLIDYTFKVFLHWSSLKRSDWRTEMSQGRHDKPCYCAQWCLIKSWNLAQHN